jgi:hypothetical protein
MTPLGYENLNFLYKCQLGLNRKNQQDLKLNLNPLEYGFYCSLNCRTLQNHCRNLIPRLRRKRGPRKTNNIELLLWSQRYECRRDHILNSRVGNMPTIEREPTDENKLQCGVSIDIHCLAKWMKDKHSKSLMKPHAQGSMITKMQGVHLVEVRDTPVILSHNEWTRDESGNAYVE